MSSWPWFPFFVDDFLASPKVQKMDLAEIGAYMLLMCEQWQVGYVDPGNLPRSLRRQPQRVAKVLSDCFEPTAHGWVNLKLDELRRGQDAKSAKAKAAAQARWGDADASPEHMRTHRPSNAIVEPEPEPEEQQQSSDAFEEVWSVARRGSKRQALHQYRRAVPAKVSHDALLAAWRTHVSAASSLEYVAHLFRWIRDERWEEAVPITPKVQADREAAEWQARKRATDEAIARDLAKRTSAPPTANEPSGPLASVVAGVLSGVPETRRTA